MVLKMLTSSFEYTHFHFLIKVMVDSKSKEEKTSSFHLKTNQFAWDLHVLVHSIMKVIMLHVQNCIFALPMHVLTLQVECEFWYSVCSIYK